MAFCIDSYELENKIFSFNKYIESIDKATDIEKCKLKIKNEFENIIRLIKNIELYTSLYYVSDDYYEDVYSTIYNHINTIINFTSVEKIKEYVLNNKEDLENKAESLFGIREYYLTDYIKSYDDLYYCSSNNPCKLNDAVLTKISLSIKNDKDINIFDPQCGDGSNLKIINNLLSPINIYALDNDDFDINSAKDISNHVIKGELNGSRISNSSFDFLFMTPRLEVFKKSKPNKRLSENNEKYILKNTLKYLKYRGVFCYTIPFYRMTKDMWLYITKNIKDINVFKHEDLEHRITIMGYKNINTSYEENFQKLSSLKYDDIISYKKFNHIYEIKCEPKEITIFRGSVLDIDEIINLVKTDGLYKEFYKSLEKEEFENNNNPLLPFNLGQIGLVLTSGQLDGVINEVGSINHVIKGMTVKNSVEEVDDVDSDHLVSTTTTSNIVQINVIDANGEFKTLV